MLMMVANYKGKEIAVEPVNKKDFDILIKFHDRIKNEKGISQDATYPKYFTQFVNGSGNGDDVA